VNDKLKSEESPVNETDGRGLLADGIYGGPEGGREKTGKKPRHSTPGRGKKTKDRRISTKKKRKGERKR